MAVRHQLVKRPREDVWAVLADRRAYAEWVTGTSESRSAEGDWPQEGASLEYDVKLGPWSLTGTTVVREEERPSRLALEVDSGRLGTARVDIEIRPWGRESSLVIVDEHPLTGLGGTVHNAAMDVVLHWRHRHMLARLAEVVEGSAGEQRGAKRRESGSRASTSRGGTHA
ncbi:SRPBCC family protein [Actinacidiphila paucisporea]|uniref:Polyketide cyclase / dehydrase and lipid transport n=1 Tax=Actinacidiphila paucisporea TaxID=310782 RepID=A0A1M7P177_9ACTN|nr:SRPBCC family protein [Actinacidiphila paucisporea]SHN09887.1 Polyketide cyclase / dehydrase and lipid transport [Actinacidiphila paucisporea]